MNLSVVVSTYNGEQYIYEQLNSLRMQSRPADEVLIFDDGSTDKTLEIINTYIETYKLKHWKCIKNNQNKGWKRNFMEGITATSGDLIFTCDQDDIWMENKLALMEQQMEHNFSIDVLASDFIRYYGLNHKERGLSLRGNLIKVDYRKKMLLTVCPGCTFCIRRTFFNKVQQYWHSNHPHDSFLWRYGMFTNGTYILNQPLVNWRKHADSTFTLELKTSNNLQGKIDWLNYADEVLKHLAQYLEQTQVPEQKQKKQTVQLYTDWLIQRRKFIKSKNPFVGIGLLKYVMCYSTVRQYLGDWVVTYLSR